MKFRHEARKDKREDTHDLAVSVVEFSDRHAPVHRTNTRSLPQSSRVNTLPKPHARSSIKIPFFRADVQAWAWTD